MSTTRTSSLPNVEVGEESYTRPTSWGSPQFTPSGLRRVAAGLRDNVGILQVSTTDLHRTVQEYDLQERAALKNRQGAPALMEELSEARGLSWNDIATAIGVSLSAIRKWRTGGECTADNRMALARLAALIDLLDEAMVNEPAGWLLTPVLPDYTVRFLDLVANGRDDLVLENAFQRMKPTELLDAYDPDWRVSSRRKFAISVDGDGVRSLRRRDR